MNGRLYDPVFGRFLQADPIIQAPHNAQSHNRYSYVLNNPLSFTDPSGFSAWTQFRAPILAIVAAITMQYYLMPYILGGYVLMGAITAGQASFISAVASGFASGGIAGGNIQSALQGAFFAGLTFGLATEFGLHGSAMGEWGPSMGKLGGQMALHTAMGCAQSAAAGGSCRTGAIAGGVSAFTSPFNTATGPSKAVMQAVIGGIASRLSGGKFENGAITAAFSYLFNECGHGMCRGQGYSGSEADMKEDGYYRSPYSAESQQAQRMLGLTIVGLPVLGLAGASVYAVPSTLYHFTTAAAAETIVESGTLWAATSWSYRALYGSGAYATAVNSPLWARISGAISTQSVITLPTGNLVVVPTIWPGTFRVLSGTAGAINVIPKP